MEDRAAQDGVRQDVSDVEQLVEESEADLERKRSVAAAAAWGGQPPSPPAEIQSVPKVLPCCIRRADIKQVSTAQELPRSPGCPQCPACMAWSYSTSPLLIRKRTPLRQVVMSGKDVFTSPHGVS